MPFRHADHPTPPERERRLFDALLGEDGGDGTVRVGTIRRVLAAAGLRPDDPRLHGIADALAGRPDEERLDRAAFADATRSGRLLLEGAVFDGLAVPEFAALRRDLSAMFREAERNAGGAVADYIPQLARVDPDQFGLAACTVDGQRHAEGDARARFCVQSVSKPINYLIALEEHGEAGVHAHMGCEPSGVSFNEIALDRNGLPHNPMINAGGIMSCALVQRGRPSADRFDHVAGVWAELTGGTRPGFSNATYLSERETGDRNYALGYSLREQQAFPDDTDLRDTLEFYFQCCSLELTCDELAVVAATLANGGLCPLTDRQVLHPENVQRCLSLMLSCGMYDYSGEWAFRVGLPAKSGVSGVVLSVVPNVMGVCTWSPRLDLLGNSVRGIDVHRRLVDRYRIHVYDGLGGTAPDKIDPRLPRELEERELYEDLCWAAGGGDPDGVQRLVVRGADVNATDEAGRTPLHVAAEEGRDETVDALLEAGADPELTDRTGERPRDAARRHGHPRLAERLEDRDAADAGG